MTLLMVTPFAPSRDGIANYSVQEVVAMRRAGDDVHVLSPTPSAAHLHLPIGSVRGMLRLVGAVRPYDRMVVQAYPEMLFGGCRNRIDRLMVWLLWILVARRIPTEFRIHEFDYGAATADPVTRWAATTALHSLDLRSVHTDSERSALERSLPGLGPVTTVDHGARFTPRTTLTKEAARQSLGLPADGYIFLSIGFVQRHKGFDRAVRAFSRLAPGDHHLYVVGDIRVDHPDLLRYRDELRNLIESTPNCERRTGYVSDSEFDRWIVAADCVVLPYREIWSSSVLERAELLKTPAIVTAVGGLADQASAGTAVVADDQALLECMAAAANAEIAPRRSLEGGLAGLESAIRRRAGSLGSDGVPRPSDHVRQVGLPSVAAPGHHIPVAHFVKRVIRRLTAWLFTPILDNIAELRSGTLSAVEELESTIDTRGGE